MSAHDASWIEKEREFRNALAQMNSIGEWVYLAALGEDLGEFAGSFAPVRRVLDERSRLTGLIEQLLEIAVANECPNCGTGYDVEESTATCEECSGERAAIADAQEVMTKAGRVAFGRAGPCMAPVTLDPPPGRCRAEIRFRTGDISHAECSLPRAHPGTHHDKGLGARWSDGDDYA